MVKIEHQLSSESFYIPQWALKYLFLGTFNPMGGESVKYYYGRKRNQMWKLLSGIFNCDFNPQNEDFFQKLKENGIGCMDMIHSVKCKESESGWITGKGYSDSKIINNKIEREYNTTEILQLINDNKDVKVFSTWGDGPTLRSWRKEIDDIKVIIPLRSPSLAARVPKGEKKFQYMESDWRNKIRL